MTFFIILIILAITIFAGSIIDMEKQLKKHEEDLKEQEKNLKKD